MSIGVTQELLPLVGVLVGGFLSTGTAMLLYRRQRRDAEEEGRRTRETAATSRIEEALVSLMGLGRRPDELRELEKDHRYLRGESLDGLPAEPEETIRQEWDRRREELLLVFETASMDLSSEASRSRLERAQRAFLWYHGPWSIERQTESATRRIVSRHALECVGAFRRGDPLPAEPKQFTSTVGDVDEWIWQQDEQDRLQREDWAKWRATHNPPSSSIPPA